MATEHSFPEVKPQRGVIIVVAVIAAVLIGGFFIFLLRRTVGDPAPPRLEAAIRKGTPEFEEYRQRIVLDKPEADQSKRALGDWVMTLRSTVRNFSGRTINGLEIWAAVVDHDGKPVRERTMVVIPGPGRDEIEPNKAVSVSVSLDRMTDQDDRADIRMEIVAFRFRP